MIAAVVNCLSLLRYIWLILLCKAMLCTSCSLSNLFFFMADWYVRTYVVRSGFSTTKYVIVIVDDAGLSDMHAQGKLSIL